MPRKSLECLICMGNTNLFVVTFQTKGHSIYCNKCLCQVLKEKPDTVLSVMRTDNIFYDLKEVENK